jgi:hypothetical protein
VVDATHAVEREQRGARITPHRLEGLRNPVEARGEVLRVSEPGVMEDIGDGNAMQFRRSRILVRRVAAELEKDLRGEIVVADVLEHEAASSTVHSAKAASAVSSCPRSGPGASASSARTTDLIHSFTSRGANLICAAFSTRSTIASSLSFSIFSIQEERSA